MRAYRRPSVDAESMSCPSIGVVLVDLAVSLGVDLFSLFDGQVLSTIDDAAGREATATRHDQAYILTMT